MFEAEVELEKKSSNVVPLLLILALVAFIVGSIAYFVLDSKKQLTQAEATQLVGTLLRAQGPATLHFHTGLVKASVDEKPRDPHYRLLEKAGYVKLADTKKWDVSQVALTAAGERVLQLCPEVRKIKETDGTTSFIVPLANRKLGQVTSVVMKGPKLAEVQYTWSWDATKLGDLFDASGSTFGQMNTWDRATLIQKYGSDYYHTSPRQTTVSFVRNDKGWKLYTE
jgi:hypothetical protein